MAESFNYIAFGDRDYVTSDLGPIEMSRGRMFEYTPTDIEKRLESLDPASVAFLEDLPTLLCSEIRREETGVSMVVKYGRIGGTTVERKEVFTTFRLLIDFGVVNFADRTDAQDLFEADGFQLYRTHWAVRNGDVQDVLTRLAHLKPEFTAEVARQGGADQAAEPPPRTKNTIGEADSVEAFLKLFYDLPPKEGTETFFRGHSDAKYELIPSLLRKRLNGSWQFMPREDRLCKELLIAHYDEFQGDQYCFDRLVRMQHYGLPTRLLDISGNPLVALFFACTCKPEELQAAGEVIIFRVSSEKVKYYDSDTVSCLANLSNLTYEQKGDIDLTVPMAGFNETPAIGRLLHHIKSEKPYFESRIVPDDLSSILCVKAKRTNSRIKSQSGAFLLFGHEATLPESGQESVEIARVTITNKADILAQLDRININATTVYPSIDQTTVHLRERFLIDPDM
jgi:hypothetical protein